MKYLLDTCIVSEMAKKAPDSKVAVVHKMKLATRNVCDMEGMGADIINPFE